jgi:hypothetical protein
MSQDLPIPRQDNRFDGTTVVEWGEAEPTPVGRAGRSLAGLARDHRLPPVLVGLGAVAAIASLLGEWLVMTLPDGDPAGEISIRVPRGVAEIGGFGVSYLVGLLALAGAVALALRGTAGVRQNARVAGLGLAAAVLAALTAAAFSLNDSDERALLYSSTDGFRVEYGRGLVSAFVATVLLAAALYLSGRAAGPRRKPDSEPSAAESDPLVPRRRRSREEELPPAPADLTVEPTMPFTHPDSLR